MYTLTGEEKVFLDNLSTPIALLCEAAHAEYGKLINEVQKRCDSVRLNGTEFVKSNDDVWLKVLYDYGLYEMHIQHGKRRFRALAGVGDYYGAAMYFDECELEISYEEKLDSIFESAGHNFVLTVSNPYLVPLDGKQGVYGRVAIDFSEDSVGMRYQPMERAITEKEIIWAARDIFARMIPYKEQFNENAIESPKEYAQVAEDKQSTQLIR